MLNFNKKQTMTIIEELKNLADKNYRDFNNKIIPTKQRMLGVRVPALRKIAKRISKNEPLLFIKSNKEDIYEMILLEGMVLSYINKPFKELTPLIECFLHKVDNWAQIDMTFCNFKSIKAQQIELLPIVRKWLNSDKEFIVRAAIVILLNHFVEKNNLNMLFKLSQNVKHSGYYVYMANAWLISVCMAKFPKETIDFFKTNTLDNKTHNKAIQKSRESLRVTKENKEIINKLKRN